MLGNPISRAICSGTTRGEVVAIRGISATARVMMIYVQYGRVMRIVICSLRKRTQSRLVSLDNVIRRRVGGSLCTVFLWDLCRQFRLISLIIILLIRNVTNVQYGG